MPRDWIKRSISKWVSLAGIWARTDTEMLARLERAGGFEAILRLLEDSDGERAIAVLRGRGARVGTAVRLHRGLVVHNAEGDFHHLEIGDGCHLGRQVLIDLADTVRIGDRVTISMRCTLLTHTQAVESELPWIRDLAQRAGLVIEADAYIGAGSTLLPGVRIGRGAVVAAGAVVVRDVPAAVIVAGVPARVIRGGTADPGRSETAIEP